MVFGSWRYSLEWQRTHQFEMVCIGSYCHVQLVLRRRDFSASETGSAATLILTVRLKRTQGKRWWTYDSWTWSGSNPRRASVLLTLGQTPGWIWEADTAHSHTHKFLAPCDALLETSRQPFLLDTKSPTSISNSSLITMGDTRKTSLFSNEKTFPVRGCCNWAQVWTKSGAWNVSSKMAWAKPQRHAVNKMKAA